MTYNTKAQLIKGQTTTYKTLHRKLNTGLHDPPPPPPPPTTQIVEYQLYKSLKYIRTAFLVFNNKPGNVFPL